MQWAQKQKGFTIVELLIVIVVIAILAAVTIVAYNGIQNRAKASSAQSAASQAAKKALSYAVLNADQYPADLTTAGLANSGDTSYQYSVNNTTNPKTFCVTATTTDVSYYVSNTQPTPLAGGCPGHGVGGVAAITNRVTNPSSETTVMSLGNGGGATIARVTNDSYHGSASSLLTKGSGWAYVTMTGNSIGVGGEVVAVTAWVKSSVSPMYVARRGSGVPFTLGTKVVTPNVWSLVTEVYTVPAGATSYSLDFGWEAANGPAGATLYVDAVMATVGSTVYPYADGSSTNWAWNGTVNNSTSTGPPL